MGCTWRAPLLALAVLAGCVNLRVPAPEIHDYRLDYSSPSINETPLPVVLRVAPFRAAAVYAREPIVYRETPYATGTYFYHRWMANPASMIADLIARDLSASGLFRAVQQGPSLVTSDYELTADVDEIEERVVAKECTAHLSLRVLLSRPRVTDGDPVVLRATYAADEPCGGDDPQDLVAAMSRALARISAQLQQDIHTAIAQDRLRTQK